MTDLGQSIEEKNYNVIDIMKFLGALMIIMIHIAPLGNNDRMYWVNFIIQKLFARIAVPFFFVSSGFFLFQKFPYTQCDVEIVVRYIKKIFRLYLTWTIIYLPLNILEILQDENGVLYGIIRYIRNFMFVGSYTQLWYLNATIFAVIFIVFLLKRKIKMQYILALAICFYGIGLLAQSWYGIITPLEYRAPQLWTVLKYYQIIFVTTRNGLFEGFLFVFIGVIYANRAVSISVRNSFIGFMVSLLLLSIECIFVTYSKYVRDFDMYIFLVPTIFFLFGLVINLQIKDDLRYKIIREMSSLVIFLHLWISKVLCSFFSLFDIDLKNENYWFLVVMTVSVICSYILIQLSDKKFKRIKKLYS